ncbi:MAG: alpha-L-fucosidase [Thermoguttaceae bacterium]
MRRMSFAVMLFLVLLSPSARAAEPTNWFHHAHWGVMTHYLGAPPSSAGGAELTAEMWNKQVDVFDVAGLVDQLVSTGAKYLLFTLGQNSGHYCSPNGAYDRIVGIKPSKCSRRDLIADLAKALSARDIRIMVYLPSGAPAADPVARKALGWRWGAKGGWQLPGEPVGGRLAEFQRNWEAVIREWSLRWGKNVSGWWIDGCYFADQMYRFDDEPNFASFARALKAGNPDAIVAFNPGVKVPVTCHTKYDDYTAGEVNLPQLAKAIDACPGRWLECEGHTVQFQILTFLGKTWCGGDRPQLPDEKIVASTRVLAEKGGVVTFDVPIQKNGLIPQPFVGQLRAIGAAMAGKATAQADATQPYQVSEDAQSIRIETPELAAAICKKGYVSGVASQSFLDKKTGFRDPGFGLDIVDWIMEPGSDAAYRDRLDPELVYRYEGEYRAYHGSQPKRSLEGPQICTKAGQLQPTIIRGKDFVAVRQEFAYRTVAPGKKTGSVWTQRLVFPVGKRYFISMDRIDAVNSSEAMFLRIDMPGHVRHNKGDTFSEIYLSYRGQIPAEKFLTDFPPDAQFDYRRDRDPVPERFIRGYRLRDPATRKDGPWLLGMTLEPSVVWEAWCHQRGYVCMIEEFGGRPVRPGQSFSAAFIVGYFDSLEDANRVYDAHKGHTALEVTKDAWKLTK